MNTAKGKAPYEVTVSPDQCCLEIAQNDIDCDVSLLQNKLNPLCTPLLCVSLINATVNAAKASEDAALGADRQIRQQDWNHFLPISKLGKISNLSSAL